MRKATQQAIHAFISGNEFTSKNTKVHIGNGQSKLYLFGNLIAVHDTRSGATKITNAGFFTNTTKERLNGLPGVRINQSKGTWYLNGKEWNGDWAVV